MQPEKFVPILPMVLVNGCEAIVNGEPTFIPKFDPRVIVANIECLLEGNPELMVPLKPYYKCFKGRIKEGRTGWTTEGLIEQGNDASIVIITELPVRRWTPASYKKLFLHPAKSEGKIQGYKDLCSTSNVRFEITLSEGQRAKINLLDGDENMRLLKWFKLISKLSNRNMRLLDADSIRKKYFTPEEILLDYFPVRLELYKMRKRGNLMGLMKVILQLENKIMFLDQIKEMNLIMLTDEDLKAKNFMSLTFIQTEAKRIAKNIVDEENVGETDDGELDYSYLYSIPFDVVRKNVGEFKKMLEQERDAKKSEFESLAETSSKSLWKKDLDALVIQLNGLLKDHDDEDNDDWYKPLTDLFGKKNLKTKKKIQT